MLRVFSESSEQRFDRLIVSTSYNIEKANFLLICHPEAAGLRRSKLQSLHHNNAFATSVSQIATACSPRGLDHQNAFSRLPALVNELVVVKKGNACRQNLSHFAKPVALSNNLSLF